MKRTAFQQWGKNLQKDHMKPFIIGFIGIHPGAGTTFSSVLFASGLAEMTREEVVCVNHNQGSDLAYLRKYYDWPYEEDKEYSFDTLHFHEGGLSLQELKLKYQGYRYIIVDFGSDMECICGELDRCHKKVMVSGSAPWNLVKLLEFYHKWKELMDIEQWHLLLPLSQGTSITYIRDQVDCICDSVPYERGPLEPSKHTMQLIYQRFFS